MNRLSACSIEFLFRRNNSRLLLRLQPLLRVGGQLCRVAVCNGGQVNGGGS